MYEGLIYDIRQPFASIGSPKTDFKINANKNMPSPEIKSTNLERELEWRPLARAGESSGLPVAIVMDGSANKLGVGIDIEALLAMPLQS